MDVVLEFFLFDSGQVVSFSGVNETDTAGTFVPAHQVQVAGVTETDVAGTFVPATAVTFGGVTEADNAGAFTPSATVTFAGVPETDTAGVFTPVQPPPPPTGSTPGHGAAEHDPFDYLLRDYHPPKTKTPREQEEDDLLVILGTLL